jgi:hypothetical protein
MAKLHSEVLDGAVFEPQDLLDTANTVFTENPTKLGERDLINPESETTGFLGYHNALAVTGIPSRVNLLPNSSVGEIFIHGDSDIGVDEIEGGVSGSIYVKGSGVSGQKLKLSISLISSFTVLASSDFQKGNFTFGAKDLKFTFASRILTSEASIPLDVIFGIDGPNTDLASPKYVKDLLGVLPGDDKTGFTSYHVTKDITENGFFALSGIIEVELKSTGVFEFSFNPGLFTGLTKVAPEFIETNRDLWEDQNTKRIGIGHFKAAMPSRKFADPIGNHSVGFCPVPLNTAFLTPGDIVISNLYTSSDLHGGNNQVIGTSPTLIVDAVYNNGFAFTVYDGETATNELMVVEFDYSFNKW